MTVDYLRICGVPASAMTVLTPLGAVPGCTGRCPARSGASTTAGWVRHRLGVTLREANQLAAVAAATRTRLSVTGQALAAGRVTLGQAGVVVRAVQALPADLDPGITARAETDLIGRAGQFDAEQLARLGEHILQVVAPQIGEAIEARRLAEQEARAAGRR